jgi:hypothetical protein
MLPLVPEKTMLDGESIDTGVINRGSRSTLSSGVRIDQFQTDYLDKDVETSVFLPAWGQGGKLFSYFSQSQAESNLEADVDSSLLIEGYAIEMHSTEVFVDEETGEETTIETSERVVDEENNFVVAIREATQSVIDFFRGLFS